MEPTSFFAPNVSPLAVLGCGILTFAVAGGLAYLVSTIRSCWNSRRDGWPVWGPRDHVAALSQVKCGKL